MRIYGAGLFQINTSLTTEHFGVPAFSFTIWIKGTVEIAVIFKIEPK